MCAQDTDELSDGQRLRAGQTICELRRGSVSAGTR